MNMAIRGLDYDFGKEPASTYTNVQHPDLRADFIMANPPFNMKEWNTGVDDNDPRFKYGQPPSGNANFAWMQHMLHHLAPEGSQALLLANGSMSSTTNNEGTIRQALIENDLIECMVALPGQLFTNTQIPACIWFLTKNKNPRVDKAGRKLRGRKGEVLFIDARNLGYMKDRVLRDFSFDDIKKVINNTRRPLIIFPQGTRVKPEERPPFKKGAVRIYEELKISCQPIAINSGYVWSKKGSKTPNKKITISILPKINKGLEAKKFLKNLEGKIYSELDLIN